jgi:cytochrome c oxidase assembly factor CtaG
MQAIANQLWIVAEVVVPLALAAAYLLRAQRLAREGRAVPAWRQLCFGCGMLVVCAATSSPVEDQAAQLISAHMVQHLLLADLASLLFVLGLTGPMLQPLLANRLARPLRALTQPIAAISIFTANLFLWHTPPLYQAVLHSNFLHLFEHLSFIATGMLLWMPLFGPLPKPEWFGRAAHVLYTAGIWLPAMALANVLMWSDTDFYPAYAAGARAHGIEPIADQSTAGAILMIECMMMALALFAWVFLRWAADDTERQDLLDLATDRQVELSSARAARAVAAGGGDRLRERIESNSVQADKGNDAAVSRKDTRTR